MKKRFIEHDLPIEEISEQSAREKNIRHGHPSTLHIWWARRPLAVSRATSFAALIDDPGPENPKEREKIKDLIKNITPWEAVKDGNDENIRKAQELIRDQYDEPPKVMDPFAGGGAIPLETLRLGCETYASDYNPVAVFIEKATLEWPQKFGVEVELPEEERSALEQDTIGDLELEGGSKKVNLLAFLVEKWANKILEEAREEIGQFYPTESGERLIGKREVNSDQKGWKPIGYLWARTIPCQNPSCDANFPLIKQFWLSKKKDKQIAYRPVISDSEISFKLLKGDELEKEMKDGFDPTEGTISRANAECLVCGQVTKSKEIQQLFKDNLDSQRLVAVVFQHPRYTGKKYRLATKKDKNIFEKAKNCLQEEIENWPFIEEPLPEEELVDDPRNLWCKNYGMTHWKDLLNPRQTLSLITLSKLIRTNSENIKADARKIINNTNLNFSSDELTKGVIGSFGIIFGNMLDLMNSLCAWEPIAEAIRHLFSRQAIPMVWDYGEVNPLATSSGSLKLCMERYCKALKYGSFDTEIGRVSKEDATNIKFSDEKFDAVITDPPYYDNVPYAALSDFFYVWLKRTVGDQFPDLFSTPLVPKSNEAIMEPTRHKDKDEAKNYFEKSLSKSFQEIHKVLKPGGISIIVYAHKSTDGWETMLNSLLEAGFVVTGSWPVHTESKSRLRAAQSAALASSIYMVCRKTEKQEVGFYRELKPKMKQKVQTKLDQFWESGIRGGDFFISAIGPAMEVFSKYEFVEDYSGDTVETNELLNFIRGLTSDYLSNRLLEEASGEELDDAARFYLTYRWTFLDNKVVFDDANRIAKAEGINLKRFYGNWIRPNLKSLIAA